MLRTTAGGSCLECRRASEKTRYHQDPAKTRVLVASKYIRNADKICAKRRASYAENSDIEKAVAKIRSAEWRVKNPQHAGAKAAKTKYKLEHPEKVRAAMIKRRVAKMHRTPVWLTADDLWVMEQAYALAVLRTNLFGFSWHVDHILPLQGKKVSGLHVPTNLQVIPWVDNIRKANTFKVPA